VIYPRTSNDMFEKFSTLILGCSVNLMIKRMMPVRLNITGIHPLNPNNAVIWWIQENNVAYYRNYQ